MVVRRRERTSAAAPVPAMLEDSKLRMTHGDVDGVHQSSADVFSELDGTVVLRFHSECRLSEAQAAAVAREHVRAARGEKRPVLADVRGLIAADRGSRQVAAGPEVSAITLRMAILVDNPLTRVLGNFFLRVTTPEYPTRIFNDEARARAWLREPA